MEEEEALRNYCRAMISRVRNKQQSFPEPRRRKHGAAMGNNWSETERQVASEHRGSNRPVLERNRDPTSPNVDQGPAVPPVPFQLITMLRIKTLKEEMRRAAEVELHGPAVCSVCAQEQASLALKTFIRRKKTQLQLQNLKGRLNTAWDWTLSGGVGAKKISQSPPMPLSGFGRNYLAKICRSQQPGVALATTKERGVALATDEMRGYPDKNATGTHLARPHCPFSYG